MTSLTRVVPHRAPMLLIDEVVTPGLEVFCTRVQIRETSMGFEDGGVPGWFGVEYMAQTIAAYHGVNYPSPDGEPEIGFLVGVRDYRTSCAVFPLGATLLVQISPSFVVENSGSFECQITIDGAMVAESMITTVKPGKDFVEALKRGGGRS